MRQVNIHFAKTHLSQLLHEVELGATIIIAKSGVAIAKIMPLKEPAKKRVLGLDKGKFEVPDDFDDVSLEIEDMFYGKKNNS